MSDYSILLEAADGSVTRQWLGYKNDADAMADWLPRTAGKKVEIMTGGRVVAHWDKRVPAGRAA